MLRVYTTPLCRPVPPPEHRAKPPVLTSTLRARTPGQTQPVTKRACTEMLSGGGLRVSVCQQSAIDLRAWHIWWRPMLLSEPIWWIRVDFGTDVRLSNAATLSWLRPSADPIGKHVGISRSMLVTGATTTLLSGGMALSRVTTTTGLPCSLGVCMNQISPCLITRGLTQTAD